MPLIADKFTFSLLIVDNFVYLGQGTVKLPIYLRQKGEEAMRYYLRQEQSLLIVDSFAECDTIYDKSRASSSQIALRSAILSTIRAKPPQRRQLCYLRQGERMKERRGNSVVNEGIKQESYKVERGKFQKKLRKRFSLVEGAPT